MGIEASVTGQPQITATVTDEKIDVSVGESQIAVSVGGGVGPTGGSGVVAVTAPVTNSGTSTAANIGLAVGSGLSVSSGTLVVTPGTYATLVEGKVPTEQLPPLASSWNDLSGKPVGDEGDVLTYVGGEWVAAAPAGAFLPLAGGEMNPNAVITITDLASVTQVTGDGVTVMLVDSDSHTTVEYEGVYVHVGSASTHLGDGVLSFTNGTSLAIGSFDTGIGGYHGISLNCAVGVELNWQAGHLKATTDAGVTSATILCDSPIEFPGDGADNVEINATGITFADGTTQASAGAAATHAAQHASDGADPISIASSQVSDFAAAVISASPPVYVVDDIANTIRSAYGGNSVAATNSLVSGGASNAATGQSSVVVGGTSNTASGNASSILGGEGNSTNGKANSHIVGAYITASAANTTYVNNLSIAGNKSGSTYTGGSLAFRDGTSQTTAWTGSVDWSAVTSKPTLFSGAYADLTGKPTLGTASSQDSSAFAAASHSHTLSAITDAGTAASRNAPASGNAGSTEVVLGSDTRLTDARTPTSHTHTSSAITDFSTAAASAAPVQSVNGQTGAVTISTYTLPQATGSTLGGITVSTGLAVSSGALSVSYGTTSGTACQGNDGRLSDSRTPTGAAGGDLTGTYPNPTIAAGAVTEADLANAVRNQMIHPFLLAGM